MSRHVNIPIFIPHLGCPNQCVFCNQRTISGVEDFDPDSLSSIIDTALETVEQDAMVEIAFFGGSFTGIDRPLMIKLLDTAYEYIKRGRVNSIRCSTRPDYINEEILTILKERGVKVIELGLQSSSDIVLAATKRGHSFEDERAACELIVKSGFLLVGQMMIGLPGSSEASELETAKFIISSGASGARIYPTVVFKGTELCSMAVSGEYKPLVLQEAISRSASVLELFLKNGVDVIRIGLCASENLSSNETYHSGPNHSAIGELVINEYYLRQIKKKISDINLSCGDTVKIKVAPGNLSKAIGQKKINKLLLSEIFEGIRIVFGESDVLSEYEISVEKEAGEKKCI